MTLETSGQGFKLEEKRTDATVRIAAKKLARDELTAWREPAKEESIVSISWYMTYCELAIGHDRVPHFAKAIQHASLRCGIMKSEGGPHHRNE